jgi:hypothetical protein
MKFTKTPKMHFFQFILKGFQNVRNYFSGIDSKSHLSPEKSPGGT